MNETLVQPVAASSADQQSNLTIKLMKKTLHQFKIQAAGAASVAILALGLCSSAAQTVDTWTGTGADGNWTTAGNWLGGIAPNPNAGPPGDLLVFGGVTGLNTTNNFVGAAFSGLSFASPSAGFVLTGNGLTLNGNATVTNNQVVTPEIVNVGIALPASPAVTVDVVPNGVLTFQNVLSGGGASGGLTMVDGGKVNLSAVNTFTGPVKVNGGNVVIGADTGLGTPPVTVTAGSLVLNGGAIEATASFVINSNRGIAVGPTSGTGVGSINVDNGQTLTYGGVIANNGGGTGGLTKIGFGTLTLSGTNLYSGVTSNSAGQINIIFSQNSATNLINPASSLSLGGGNSGVGGQNNAIVNVVGKSGTTNGQNFASTFLTFGGSIIEVTNSGGNTVTTMNLGAVSHNPGGTLLFLPLTPSAAGNSTNDIFTTTSANLNGILGGFAFIGDGSSFSSSGFTQYYETNYATVGAGGVITNYNNYFAYSSGNLQGQVGPGTNLLLHPTSQTVYPVAPDNSFATIDVNTIKIYTTDTGGSGPGTLSSIYIGPNNILRLGQYGGILKMDKSGDTMWLGGANSAPQSGSGTVGSQNVGTLTAGGAPNTPGEIVMMNNAVNNSSGTFNLECAITDNGTGPVTFVKVGMGSIKIGGHNSYSGGLYLLQGRVQFTGAEIGSAATTGNPDGGGTGPIYILPGCYLFPGGFPTGASITNAIFIAGSGTPQEQLGAIRGGAFSGPVTLIGDTDVGAGCTFNGPISGPYNLMIGSRLTSVTGGATLNNSGDSWTGDTIMASHLDSGANTVTSGTNEVIPNGFGKGNVIMNAATTGTITWNLNGWSETINGLSTATNATAGVTCFITTTGNAGSNSVLSVGDNNQSATFAGVITDTSAAGGSTVSLTKIGNGVETLTGSNSYAGPTTINLGSLAFSGSGSISHSPITVNSGGTLDISGSQGAFTTAQPLNLVGGNLTDFAGPGTFGDFNTTNGSITINVNTATNNVFAASLHVGGTTNLVNINSVLGVTAYPAQFTLIKYSGTYSGVTNFGLGTVPNTNTVGYVTNDAANSRVLLVLLSGPEPLTWTGTDPTHPTFWDQVTTNWIAFKGTANQTNSNFHTADAVTLDDTGSAAPNISVQQFLLPGNMLVTNNAVTYNLTNTGFLNIKGNFIKDGPGTLIIDNGGNNSIGVSSLCSINHGTVQIGNNDNNGNIIAAIGLTDNGSLVFNRNDLSTNNDAISGTGSVTENNAAGTITLAGANSFSGGLNVSAGTVKASNANALGSTNGTTTVSSGATLDVNGTTLNIYSVVASGSGVGGNGAIYNSGAQVTTALGNLTLAGNTTFGGVGRWDIRGGAAILSSGGQPYTIVKLGTNQISLVGITMDAGLGDIDVSNGVMSFEQQISSLGNPGNTINVANPGGIQFYNCSNALTKNFVLNGGPGTNVTVNCGNNIENNINGSVVLNGNVNFNAASGTAITFNGAFSTASSAKLLISGTGGTNTFSSSVTANYGNTLITNGATFVVDGSLTGNVSTTGTNANSGTLAGIGTISGAVGLTNATIWPGDIANTPYGTLTVGSLTLSNSTILMYFGTAPTNLSGNDLIAVNGNVSVIGNATNKLMITPVSFMNVGDRFTNITYTGSLIPNAATVSNLTAVTSTRPGYSFHMVDPGTTANSIVVVVDSALGNDIWTGIGNNNWDTNSLDGNNWKRGGAPVVYNNNDYATFDDTSSANNVNITNVVGVSGITMNNSTKNYTFSGPGAITNGGTLVLNNSGTLTIANAGFVGTNAANNVFQGTVTVNAGTLQLGNGTTNGDLGPGSGFVTNNSTLLIARDGTAGIAKVIGGTGVIIVSNAPTGVVSFSGANTFSGNVYVEKGTLRVNNSTALGNTASASTTTVFPGATLDITNNANEAKSTINIGGTGVGGNGALVNNGGSTTFVGQMLGSVNLTTNLTIGGTGRIDLRASAANNTDVAMFMVNNPSGVEYNVTKVGTNLFQMAGVQVDPNLGNVTVSGGYGSVFGVQWLMPFGLGDPGKTLTITNAQTVFGMFSVSNAIYKNVVMYDGTSIQGQQGTNNEIDGPVAMNGTNILSAHSSTWLRLNGPFSGSGALFITNDNSGGRVILGLPGSLSSANGPLTYTGNTYLFNGTIAIIDPIQFTNSPFIAISNATVDVSARSDDTFALGGGGLNQTMIGGGTSTINGIFTQSAGSTINVGDSKTATLIITNGAATFSGALIMNLDTSSSRTNDEIVNNSITVSGPLTVTNIGPRLHVNDRFVLFSTAVSGFSSVTLPVHDAQNAVSYTWNNNLGSDGSITVASEIVNVTTNPPPHININISGGNLTMTWSNNYLGYIVQVQTNKLTTGLSTNWFTISGTDSGTNFTAPVVSDPGTNQSVFYRLQFIQ